MPAKRKSPKAAVKSTADKARKTASKSTKDVRKTVEKTAKDARKKLGATAKKTRKAVEKAAKDAKKAGKKARREGKKTVDKVVKEAKKRLKKAQKAVVKVEKKAEKAVRGTGKSVGDAVQHATQAATVVVRRVGKDATDALHRIEDRLKDTGNGNQDGGGTSKDETKDAKVAGVGAQVPDFNLEDQDGKTWTNEDLAGKTTVLYFYPKDDTTGCTKQACGFRDDYSQFQSKGVQLLGVSGDSVESHHKFAVKYNLPFPLLSDPDHQLIEGLGVWQEKNNYGRTYMGIMRTTFLVKDGKVTGVWERVHPEGHSRETLEAAV